MSTLLPSPKKRPQKSHIIVMLSSIAAACVATVTVLDSWDKVLTKLGFEKPESFVLAEMNTQGQFLRDIVHMISRRVFWAERYSGNIGVGFPAEILEEAWKWYEDSVIKWNESYMLNVQLTHKYFGDQSRKRLVDLHFLMRESNNCLVRLRYRSLYEATDPACHFDDFKSDGTEADNLRALNKAMKKLRVMVQEFADIVVK
jgi:hypothetical protein